MTLPFGVYDSWFDFSFTVQMPGWIEFICICTVNVGVTVHCPYIRDTHGTFWDVVTFIRVVLSHAMWNTQRADRRPAQSLLDKGTDVWKVLIICECRQLSTTNNFVKLGLCLHLNVRKGDHGQQEP